MMLGWSVRTRVLFLALGPAAVILVLLTTWMTYLRVAETERSLEQRGAALARHVARAAEFGLFSGDRGELQRVADAAQLDPDVAGVLIFDAGASVVARTGALDPAASDGTSVVFVEPVMESLLQVSDVPEKAQKAPEVRLGEVRVAMSRSGAVRAESTLWQAALIIGLTCLAIAAVLALLIGGSVTQQIRMMAAAIARIASGRLDERLPFESGGELRALADDINHMASALEASQRDLETRIERATRQLQAQKRAAEAANEAKSRFLAAASHDLRQPLHAIELLASALRYKVRGKEAREVFDKLDQAIGSMDSLFNSLLDVYRLDSGVLKVRPRLFALRELIRSLEAEFRGEAQSRGLRLRFAPTAKVAHCDPVLLRRILANLISNALRYTPAGSVMVVCRRDGNGAVRIEVRDSGAGIEAHKHDLIFQEFYRIEGVEEEQGKGLGLAIVARVAALLDTQVHVRSAPGKGSCFSIIVPRGGEDAPVERAAPQRISAAGDPSLEVLIIDDDPLVLQSTLAAARDWALNIATASSIEDARREMLGMRFGAVLVLCDLWLADSVSGLDVLAALRDEWTGILYGVIVTGDARPEALRQIQDSGHPILYKPVSAARLRATLMHYVQKARRDLQRKPEP
jgi:two-component system, sensor histidine kinase